MRASLLVMMFLVATILAKDHGHLDDHALEQLEIEGLDDSALATELDCPMVDVRIQGSLTGMQPGILIWEECGERKYLQNCLIKYLWCLQVQKQKYVRNCLIKDFSSFVLHEGSSVQVLDAIIDVEEQLLLSLVLDVGHNWTTKLY